MHEPTKQRPGRARVWLNRLGQLLLLLAVFFAVQQFQKRNMPDGPAPELAGFLRDGTAYTLPGKPSRPVLVHFWATWCPVCDLEHGSIESIAKEYDVITVAMQSGDDVSLGAWMRENGLTFPVINDPVGELSKQWGVIGVPASFVIDSAGEIRFVEVGYTTGPGLRLRLLLAGII